jgi:hypothetical protein
MKTSVSLLFPGLGSFLCSDGAEVIFFEKAQALLRELMKRRDAITFQVREPA